MGIKEKNIILEINKKCKICGRYYSKNGIMIIKNSICEDCIRQISNLNIDNQNYDNVKNKIKNILKDFSFI